MIVLATAGAAHAAGGVTPFTSEHSARGVIYNMMLSAPIVNPQDGFGMACADLDGDDDLDLVLLGRADGLVGIFENNGNGTFVNRSATSGAPATPSGCGVSAFDYDRDGDLDVFIAQKNLPCRLLRNDGAMAFTDVAAAAGVAATLPATGCSVADFDGDGWLDLHVCTYSRRVAEPAVPQQRRRDLRRCRGGSRRGVGGPLVTNRCGAISTGIRGRTSA